VRGKDNVDKNVGQRLRHRSEEKDIIRWRAKPFGRNGAGLERGDATRSGLGGWWRVSWGRRMRANPRLSDGTALRFAGGRRCRIPVTKLR
jgi:hypothetical protein